MSDMKVIQTEKKVAVKEPSEALPRPKLESPEEVEQEAEPSEARKVVNRFLDSDQTRFSKKRSETMIRGGKSLLGLGISLAGLGLLGVAGGAGLTGGTMGAGAPVGAPLMASGLGLIAGGVTSAALGIVLLAKKGHFNSAIKKSGLDKSLTKQLKKDYPKLGLRTSKLNILALQIKFDNSLSGSEKADLLQPYRGKTGRKDIKNLKAEYTDLKELNQLKALFQEHFPDEDFSQIKGQNFDTFYRKAKAQVGRELPFTKDLEGVQKSKGRKELLSKLEKEYGSDSHFWKRLSDLHKAESKPKKSAKA